MSYTKTVYGTSVVRQTETNNLTDESHPTLGHQRTSHPVLDLLGNKDALIHFKNI